MPTRTFEASRPSIFMSPEGGDAHWRLMEKLAAIFELQVNPKPDDVFTFSSAQVPDCISSSEQVDAAYSYVPDPTRFFSFLEVRDRTSNIGRGYIQEVIGKRKSLGVDDCCVVSTKGFAPDALRLAEHEGIRVRSIEAAGNRGSEFFGLQEFVVHQTAPDIQSCRVFVLDDERQRTGTFTIPGAEVFQRGVIVVTPEGGRLQVPLEALLDRVLASGGWHQLEEAGGEPISLGFKLTGPGLKLVYTEKGTGLSRELDIMAVSYVVKSSVGEVRLPRGETYYYRDALSGELLAEAVLFMASRQRTAVCMVRTLAGPHRANAILFLSEAELSELVEQPPAAG